MVQLFRLRHLITTRGALQTRKTLCNFANNKWWTLFFLTFENLARKQIGPGNKVMASNGNIAYATCIAG